MTFACRNFSPPDIAIDLGTAFTRVWSSSSGHTTETWSAIAAPDESAKDDALFPLRGGVIVDVDSAKKLLASVLRPLRSWQAEGCRVLACIPTDATEDERLALEEAVSSAGASRLSIVFEPVAAALGTDLDVGSARILVDIGDGVTDVGVLEHGTVIFRRSLRLACSDIREDVWRAAESVSQLDIHRNEADRLMRLVCSGAVGNQRIHGFGKMGEPATVEARLTSIAPAIQPAINTIAQFVADAFQAAGRTAGAQVARQGLWLTGGGSLLPALVDAIARDTGAMVRFSRRPLSGVINGARRLLETGPFGWWSASDDGAGDLTGERG